MKMQSLLFIFFLAIALVGCISTETDVDMKPISKNEKQQTSAEAVVRDRRGANGGSDLTTKPSQTKSIGAADLPVISFCVSMFLTSFFMLQN
ncbi:hypothetical protein SASPL_108902 [Salvia splendens]|uniref:Lipoprotein n=1 Tax=Salvia splendens TaxID=180675 RepID=A0A8X9A8M9_SALSN|nr:hypothetical protein SASPL_108902 [Salvia splendens]